MSSLSSIVVHNDHSITKIFLSHDETRLDVQLYVLENVTKYLVSHQQRTVGVYDFLSEALSKFEELSGMKIEIKYILNP